MPQVTFRVVLAKKANMRAVIDEVVRTHQTQVIDDIDGYYFRITGDWSAENRPKLKHSTSIIRGLIKTVVYPEGEIYKYVTGGTRKNYPIPKLSNTKAKTLRFQEHYTPRTKPGGKYGGPGRKSGAFVFRKRVIHPGIKARNFENEIARDYQPKYMRLMNAAIKRGLAAAKRGAK